MKTIPLTIGGKTVECADCVSWTLDGDRAVCALGIEPMDCKACERGVPRQRLTPKPVPSLTARAVSWAKAEASGILSSISEEQIESRLAACLACEHRERSEADPVGFCTRCGCGRSPAAALTRKARLPAATCPANRW
jgi:hypothetical protein